LRVEDLIARLVSAEFLKGDTYNFTRPSVESGWFLDLYAPLLCGVDRAD
jgi:hypothetical protein